MFHFHKDEPSVSDTLRSSDGDSSGLDGKVCREQLNRILLSPRLKTSEGLSRLLAFLADLALNGVPGSPSEYQIATEILGRSAHFDPQIDSGVRVQIGRLRIKLAEYYAAEGAGDTILVEIKRGQHSLTFSRRPLVADNARQQADERTPAPAVPVSRLGRFTKSFVAVGVAILVAAAFFLGRSSERSAHTANLALEPSLQRFWTAFASSSEPPDLVFSDAEFVGDPRSGMYYYDRARDEGREPSHYYTGIGEVMGAVEIDRILAKAGVEVRLKPGALFSLDDARFNNLIFLGSPAENGPLGRLPSTRDFAFRWSADQPLRWSDLVNLHPHAGEQSLYRSTLQPAKTQSDDYAIIALLHGLDPTHRTLLLEGLSTISTQAAVEYVTNEATVAQLLGRLNVTGKSSIPDFESVIHVQVSNDVPISTELVALHVGK